MAVETRSATMRATKNAKRKLDRPRPIADGLVVPGVYFIVFSSPRYFVFVLRDVIPKLFFGRSSQTEGPACIFFTKKPYFFFHTHIS